jgi:site-specific recombinase XerD
MRVAKAVELFVGNKRASGYIYYATAKVLTRFAEFVGPRRAVSSLSDSDAKAFLSHYGANNNTWRRYCSFLRQFFFYWHARRQLRRIPILPEKPSVPSSFFPYIYSRAEIRKLTKSVDTCQGYWKCAVDAETLRIYILLVYGTGINVEDALRLDRADVNFETRCIDLGKTSFWHRRSIPISVDVARMLKRYVQGRSKKSPTVEPLFATLKGERVRYAVVRHSFQRLREIAGIKRVNSYYQPRLHDLRHSFAVHSIAALTEKGYTLQKLLPMLAAYMGNADLMSFERYAALAPSNYKKQLMLLR